MALHLESSQIEVHFLPNLIKLCGPFSDFKHFLHLEKIPFFKSNSHLSTARGILMDSVDIYTYIYTHVTG